MNEKFMLSDVNKVKKTKELVEKVNSFFDKLSGKELSELVKTIQPWKNAYTFEVAGKYSRDWFLVVELGRKLREKEFEKFRVIKGNLRFEDNRVANYEIDPENEIVVILYDTRHKWWVIYGEDSASLNEKLLQYSSCKEYIDKEILEKGGVLKW